MDKALSQLQQGVDAAIVSRREERFSPREGEGAEGAEGVEILAIVSVLNEQGRRV